MCSMIPAGLFVWITCSETELLMSDFVEGGA